MFWRLCQRWYGLAVLGLGLSGLSGCGPGTSTTGQSGTDSASESSGADPETSSLPTATEGSASETDQPGCASEADLVVGTACYRIFELAEERAWDVEKSAAVRFGDAEDARLLIETVEHPLVILSQAEGTFEIEAELDFEAGPAPIWPPMIFDIDEDGRNEAVFGTYGPGVHVVDTQGGGEPFEAPFLPEFLLPAQAGLLVLALELGGADGAELVAATASGDPDEPLLTVLERQDGEWMTVGQALPVRELAAEPFVLKPLPDKDGSAQQLAYLQLGDGADFEGVAVVQVSSEGDLTFETSLEPGFPISDFETGDFDANGLPDIYAAGYDSNAEEYRNAVFFQHVDGWSDGESFELGESTWAVVGDMTGNGVADLLTVTRPTRVVDLHDDLDVNLVDAAWPVALHDVNGDAPRDLLYRSFGATSLEPTPLLILLSLE